MSRFGGDQSRGNGDLFVIFIAHFWRISRRRKLSSSARSGSNKQDGSINRMRRPSVSLPPPPPLLLLLGSLMGRELLLRRGLRCKLICSNSAVISIKAAWPFFLPPSYWSLAPPQTSSSYKSGAAGRRERKRKLSPLCLHMLVCVFKTSSILASGLFSSRDEFFIADRLWTAQRALGWCFSIRTDVSIVLSAPVSHLCNASFFFCFIPFQCGLGCTWLPEQHDGSLKETHACPTCWQVEKASRDGPKGTWTVCGQHFSRCLKGFTLPVHTDGRITQRD